ncbi:MAG TPA: beta-propeller fold lactonase family protein [Solirubrobacteraceae bacterium]|nr:beta-propeller fold lactonase family protein [Solirubrobacteraceae bacterium]
MHPLLRAAARLSALAAGLTVAVTGVASAHASPRFDHQRGSPVVGHLYVNDNTAPANTVAGFDRHADGTLTPIPGSPFATGGAGTGAGIGSQGALQMVPSGHELLAVDPGSNEISQLLVGRDGRLWPVRGGTVSSGGSEPVSIAIARGLVYVANAGAGASNYTGFAWDRFGRLRPIPGATFSLPDAAQPGDVLINSTASRLVGTRVATSQIDSFTIDRRGGLHPAAGSPFAAQGPGPFGSEFSPINPDQVFVSNAHGGAGAGTVSAFNDGPQGVLSSIGDSPFPNGQTAPCWVEISRDGRHLFAVNTAVPSVSSYRIRRDGTLRLIENTPFDEANAASLGPEDAGLSPDASTLWVVDTKGDSVSGFAVRGGRLAEIDAAQTALPAGAAPFGVVVN